MTIFSVYIINKAGGLIYQYDNSIPRPEVEKTFSFPLELVLKGFDDKIVVAFGERDGIKGMWQALREVFPGASLHGCGFHWAQAVQRHVGQVGLQATYQHREGAHQHIRKLLALPFLPARDIPRAFRKLREKVTGTSAPLEDLFQYVEDQWLESSLWSPDEWSVYRRPIRTNNDTEVGHTLLSVNGVVAEGKYLQDGREIMEVLRTEENYPISIKFGRPKLTTNERIMLASMFHSLFAIGSQLSPETHSSGIEVLETDTFKLNCQQTMTGLKFIVISDPKQAAVDSLLRKLYEVYADFALKNPFYSLDMPIRCDLFDTNLQLAIEQAEKLGISNV